MAEKRTLTLESQYCNNWTVENAIRELIQNAVDTGTKIEFSQHGNMWRIKDNGSGVQLSDFLIGRSSKINDDDAIGQFGEGAPIGCLVLTRAGRDVKVYSNNKRYAFSFEHDNQWGCQLLTITIDNVSTARGTVVDVECSADEMKQVQEKFLTLTPQQVLARTGDTEFLACSGSVYVNGLEVSNIESIFGYNFKKHKRLINRDRNAIGFADVLHSIKSALETITNERIIRQILVSGESGEPRNVVEVGHDFWIKYPDKWKSAVKYLWGDKVCLANNTHTDITASEQNWKVLSLPWGLRFSLARVGIVKPSSEAINDGKKKEYILQRHLSQGQRNNLRLGRKIAKYLAEVTGLKTYPIRVFKDLNRQEGTGQFASLGSYCGGIVEIEENTLASITKLVGVLIHEYVHGTTGHADNTREFENCLGDIIAKIGMRCYEDCVIGK